MKRLLLQLLDKWSEMASQRTSGIMAQRIFIYKHWLNLSETLKSIHEAGILHNDIKKENILIDESGNPCIIDFGFSTRSCSPVAQMEETNLLLSLVESTWDIEWVLLRNISLNSWYH